MSLSPTPDPPVGYATPKLDLLTRRYIAGPWLADEVAVTGRPGNTALPTHKGKTTIMLPFTGIPNPVKSELKIAFRSLLEAAPDITYITLLKYRATWHRLHAFLIEIADVVAAADSVIAVDKTYWLAPLEAHLVRQGLRPRRERVAKWLNTQMEFPVQKVTDSRILLFVRLYDALVELYDFRVGFERDVWEREMLGIEDVPNSYHQSLDFRDLVQPWLKQDAKEWVRDLAASNFTYSNIRHKLVDMRKFSRFLTENYPDATPASVTRAMALHYKRWLHERHPEFYARAKALGGLRQFITFCALDAERSDYPKEQIILDRDLPKAPGRTPDRIKDIPEEVYLQIEMKLHTMPQTLARMVTIEMEFGLRVSELLTLKNDCLFHGGEGDWYLEAYQHKVKNTIRLPIVHPEIRALIEAIRDENKSAYGDTCTWLFPQPCKPHLPFNNVRFNVWLNLWGRSQDVRGADGKLWHFKSHQFRHKRALKWLLEDELDLPTIRLLLGHKSITMTEVYATKKLRDIHSELLAKKRRKKVVDYQGNDVKTDPRTESADALVLRSVFRGASLPIGGCAKPIMTGECAHLNKCFSCAYHITTTDDLPLLKEARFKTMRVLTKAREVGNEHVTRHNEELLAGLNRRIEALEGAPGDGDDGATVGGLVEQWRADLLEAETSLEDAREARLFMAVKALQRAIDELKAKITMAEGVLSVRAN